MQTVISSKIDFNKKSNFSILVNTCDSYSDCWDAFFKLFSFYWPDYKGNIYLNTERKDYSYGNLNIVPIKGCEFDKEFPQAPWGVRLNRAIDKIESEIILYLQEDYFLKDFVKDDYVKKYVELMLQNESIDCIHLTDQSLNADDTPSCYEGLFPASLLQRYRASLQAALWRKDVIKEYIRPNESIWEFEEFGSKRGAILKHDFYVVDKNWVKLNEFELIPYIFTGITQGRWKEEVVPLFDKHGIIVNFEIRGYLKDVPRKSLGLKLYGKWKRIPILINHFFDAIKLKAQ